MRACASDPFRAGTRQSFGRAEVRRCRRDSCPTAPYPVKLFSAKPKTWHRANIRHYRFGFLTSAKCNDSHYFGSIGCRQLVPDFNHLTAGRREGGSTSPKAMLDQSREARIYFNNALGTTRSTLPELERSLRVFDRKRHVRQPVGLDHVLNFTPAFCTSRYGRSQINDSS
jgi:hypothetical protein